jgi:hypothetical protein
MRHRRVTTMRRRTPCSWSLHGFWQVEGLADVRVDEVEVLAVLGQVRLNERADRDDLAVVGATVVERRADERRTSAART